MTRALLSIILLTAFYFVTHSQSFSKKILLPDTIWRVPAGNDWRNPESEFSFHRRAETENIVAFWSKSFGEDPLKNPDSLMRFDIHEALQECERFYQFYMNELAFLEKGKSKTDSFKIVLIIFGEQDGTAYGGGEMDKIGMLWTSPVRIRHAPHGALAHELGHSFQYLTHADGHWAFTSAPDGSHGHSIFEMTSQYMLWQVYPEWMTFENYHLKDFMKQTHLAFLHEHNMYHSPYVLEYWAQLHGPKFIGKLWREAREGEDVVEAYQRITKIDQSQFNDELMAAYLKFITWDLDRIRDVASSYANQHQTKLNSKADDWLEISKELCPQNYGYNAIHLIPGKKSKISIEFEGLTSAEGFRIIQPENAGWRYGWVALQTSGERVYGKIASENTSKVSFKLPPNTDNLWFVVMGAPTQHTTHLIDGKIENDEQWPYRIRIKGATVHSDFIETTPNPVTIQ